MSHKTEKIMYQLERNQDGYPPVSVEQVNAVHLSGDTYRIENAPFFAPNVSYHDLVRAMRMEDGGALQFIELIEESKFTSISIIIFDSAMDTFLMDLLRGLNCVVEYGEFGVFRVLAVAVPPSADYLNLRATLVDLESLDKISFAELSLAH